jgi:hypothetical protein
MAWGEEVERLTEMGGELEHPAVIAPIATTNSSTLVEHSLDIRAHRLIYSRTETTVMI